MKLYGFPNTRSTRALWTLEEAGLPYEYVHVDLMKGEARRPPFSDLNPGCKLPALVDDDLVLTESAAICTYIAERAPDAHLVPPAGGKDRARFTQWCFFALTELEQALWTVSKHRLALPEKRRVPAIMETARWEFSVAAKVLAQGLGEREYIVGDRFSVADILIANTLEWARRLEAPFENDKLERYASRMTARPALARALARESAQ